MLRVHFINVILKLKTEYGYCKMITMFFIKLSSFILAVSIVMVRSRTWIGSDFVDTYIVNLISLLMALKIFKITSEKLLLSSTGPQYVK